MTKIGGWAGVPGVLNCCWLRCAGGAICEEEVKVFSWPASWLLLPRLWACFWALSEKPPEADSSIESLSMLSKKKESLSIAGEARTGHFLHVSLLVHLETSQQVVFEGKTPSFYLILQAIIRVSACWSQAKLFGSSIFGHIPGVVASGETQDDVIFSVFAHGACSCIAAIFSL